MERIKLHEMTILTGDNSSGKSLIRKLLWSHVNEQLGVEENKSKVADTSMARRTRSHADLGGAGAFLRDTDWNSTSSNTFAFLEGLFKSSKGRFLVIDEMELGCGEELQLGLCEWLNKMWKEKKDEYLGCLVITHSRLVVKNVTHNAFLNIQGMNEEEWLTREIVPITPEQLRSNNRELFQAVQKRLKQ